MRQLSSSVRISGFSRLLRPLFGRRETREHSGHYLQALLVQSGERRKLRTCRRRFRGQEGCSGFSPRDDEVIIGRLQEYLRSAGHPEGVGELLDGSDFPKQGSGVARQYCWRLREGGQLPAGMFLAYVSPAGTGIGGQGAVSARELDLGQRPV